MLQKIVREREPFLRQYIQRCIIDNYKKMPRHLWIELTDESASPNITIYRFFGHNTDYGYSISIRPDEYLYVYHNSIFHRDFYDFLNSLTGWQEITEEEEKKNAASN